MAEVTIRQWRLSVLRVRLDLTGPAPTVHVALVSFEGDEPRELWHRDYDPQAFGIPPQGPPVAMHLPAEVLDLVAGSFASELSEETALWLRLVTPYGYLGAAPWEHDLVPLIRRPLLRVPDRLPIAADFGTRWTAVVALSARPGTGWAAPYLSDYLDALHTLVGDLLDVHVFADAPTVDQVRTLREEEPWWHLHDPREVTLPALGRPAVWGEWIRSGLEGRAVRALHLVTAAAFDDDRAMLLVPPDPVHPDPGHAGFVQIEAALRLTDAIGAATLSFGSPPDNVSDLATRVLADDLGQRRPGPTLYSSLAQDPSGAALAFTHAYLADPARSLLPVGDSQFLYAQPEHLSPSLLQEWPTSSGAITSDGDPVLPVLTAEGVDLAPVDPLSQEVPAWVASCYRFLGERSTRSARDDTDAAYAAGVSEALDDLKALVARETP